MNTASRVPLPHAPPVAALRVPRRRFRWDQVTIYLPMLLMALLALLSYWLLRATPLPIEPAPERPLSHEPDHVMRRFALRVFGVDGSLRSEIFGAEARHRPNTNMLEIDQARIRVLGAGGQLTTATAHRVVSNAEQTAFTLEGDAVVIRDPVSANAPQLEFRGEYLQVHTDTERVTSDRPVLLVRGSDRLTADRLEYRGKEQTALLQGRVRATLTSD